MPRGWAPTPGPVIRSLLLSRDYSLPLALLTTPLFAPGPVDRWLCGHFVAKAYAVLAEHAAADPSLRPMLWQTKSAIQPRDQADEWAQLCAMDPATREWAESGRAESTLRPGKVDVTHGSPQDYRGLMTEVDVGEGVPIDNVGE